MVNKFREEFLTKLSIASVILPYYGYAHEWRELLVRLRKGSNQLWKENFVAHPISIISSYKQRLQIDICDESQLVTLFKKDRF